MRSLFSRMKSYFHSSTLLPTVQLPSKMETHLWYVKPSEVKSESLLKQYFNVLSPCEKENLLEIRAEEQRKSALLARVLVRSTIARYQIKSQVSPRSLKFRKNMHGKPELEWPVNNDEHLPRLHFNISHTSSLVACGVTVDSQIGIDIEEKHRIIKHSILSFARRYFTQHEVQSLASLSDPQVQQQEFIKLWTLKVTINDRIRLAFSYIENAGFKYESIPEDPFLSWLITEVEFLSFQEAYVKAIGKGFSGAPFRTFTIRLENVRDGYKAMECPHSEASEITLDSFDGSSDLTNDCQFLLLELAGSYYAAICTENIVKTEGRRIVPMKLKVWNTIPFLEDEFVSGTVAVKIIGGLKGSHFNKKNGEEGQHEDLVDVLLKFQDEGLEIPLTNDSIKAVILDILGAGSETSATEMDWAMVEMLNNPTVLEKAQH